MLKKVNQSLQTNARHVKNGYLRFSVNRKESEEVFVVLKQRRLEWYEPVKPDSSDHEKSNLRESQANPHDEYSIDDEQ